VPGSPSQPSARSPFLYLVFVNPTSSQGLELYGYSLNVDLTKVKSIFSKVAFSFELTPIFKTSDHRFVCFYIFKPHHFRIEKQVDS
jgi:hypothetical protein